MRKSNIQLQDAISNIAGFWYNSAAKTSYCFHFLDKEYSDLYLRQDDRKNFIKFQYRLLKDDEKLILEIDGEKFKLEKIISKPQKKLCFSGANNNVIELYKHM
jgi:hypothetical protein